MNKEGKVSKCKKCNRYMSDVNDEGVCKTCIEFRQEKNNE